MQPQPLGRFWYYIFEFIDSDLSKLMNKHKGGMEESSTLALTRQLLVALAHLHLLDLLPATTAKWAPLLKFLDIALAPFAPLDNLE